MPIYRYRADGIEPVEPATFSQLGITERSDLQRLLRDRIDIIAEDTLVIAEEFGNWDDSRRRIDLLAIDRNANLVVIELKRTEDGGHMELQALRYAAMVSTITFQQAVNVFEAYLRGCDDERDAEETLLDFLRWDEPLEDDFATDVRIVLASAEFSKELTTAVLWLCERGIDIRCVRLRPYGTREETLLDVQQVIPLAEAEDYQIRVREKRQVEREARKDTRDNTKFDVTVDGVTETSLAKRRAILAVMKGLCGNGISVRELDAAIPWRSGLFQSAGSDVDGKRFFIQDDELVESGGERYAFTNQWGLRTEEAMHSLINKFQPTNISFRKSD